MLKYFIEKKKKKFYEKHIKITKISFFFLFFFYFNFYLMFNFIISFSYNLYSYYYNYFRYLIITKTSKRMRTVWWLNKNQLNNVEASIKEIEKERENNLQLF